MSFGENLQYYRTENNMTQEQLAERLEVSRQSVSKWESDSSFPEMDKLLALCEMFHCTLDVLLRGDAKASRQQDTAGYEAHMNRFSRMITAGVVLCLCGMSAGGVLEAVTGSDRWSGAVLLLFVLAAVVLFIIGGIQHNDFCTHYAKIEPFYEESVLAQWRQRFPVFMAVGVALCIASAILMGLAEGVLVGNLSAGASEDFLVSCTLLLLAAGVGLLVYGGMQNGKYHVETYNRERAQERSPRYQRLGKIQGAIMLGTTAVGLIYFFFWKVGIWEAGEVFGVGIGIGEGVIFAVGGLLCAIAASLFKEDE